MNTTKRKQFYVWHIPQVPGKAFIYDTDSLDEALHVADLLADYDAFQYEHNIKPDYCDVNGVCEWDDDEGEYFDIERDCDMAAESGAA